MLVVHAISRDPSLALQNRTFPKNPCMLVICPTKALEEDMVSTEQIRHSIILTGRKNSPELKHDWIWTAYNGYQRRHNSSSTNNPTKLMARSADRSRRHSPFSRGARQSGMFSPSQQSPKLNLSLWSAKKIASSLSRVVLRFFEGGSAWWLRDGSLSPSGSFSFRRFEPQLCEDRGVPVGRVVHLELWRCLEGLEMRTRSSEFTSGIWTLRRRGHSSVTSVE